MSALFASILQEARYIAEPAKVATGWAAGLAVSTMQFPVLESLVGYLLGWWLLLATGELVTCFLATNKALRKGFAWERKITGKFLLVMLVLVAMSLDWMLYQLGTALPGEWSSALVVVRMPITTGSLVWLALAEGARIVVNVGNSEGRDSIPPVVRWVLLQMKRIDQQRYPAKDYVPHTRWSDPENLSDEQIRWLLTEGGVIDAAGRPTLRETATPKQDPEHGHKDADGDGGGKAGQPQ